MKNIRNFLKTVIYVLVCSINIFKLLRKRVKTICNHEWSYVTHDTKYPLPKSFVATHVLGYIMCVMYTELVPCI